MSMIKKENDGTFTVDFIKSIDGKRYHISKKGYKSFEEAERAMPTLLERRLSLEKKIRVSGKFSSFFKEYLEHRS